MPELINAISWSSLILVAVGAVPGIVKDIASTFFKSKAKLNELKYKNKLENLLKIQESLLSVLKENTPSLPTLDENKIKEIYYKYFGIDADDEFIKESFMKVGEGACSKVFRIFFLNRHFLSKETRQLCDSEYASYQSFTTSTPKIITTESLPDLYYQRQMVKHFRTFAGIFFLGILKAIEKASDKLS